MTIHTRILPFMSWNERDNDDDGHGGGGGDNCHGSDNDDGDGGGGGNDYHHHHHHIPVMNILYKKTYIIFIDCYAAVTYSQK